MLKSPEIRAAEVLLREHRKANRKARTKPPAPKHKNAPTRVHDKPYLAWLRRQKCAVGPVGCSGPTQAAHVRSTRPGEPPTGLGRKPDDRRATALCAHHHAAQHDAGDELRWWASHGKDPHVIAEEHHAKFRTEAGAA